MDIKPTIFVVDDDPGVREGLRILLRSAGRQAEFHGSAAEFLQALSPDRPGCLVLDLRMPGISGLDLQDRLKNQGCDLPIIIITGHGEVSDAVRAMKAGALDLLEKPFDDEKLLRLIDQAVERDAKLRRERAERKRIQTLAARLTSRELDVLRRISAGHTTKQIARAFSVSTQAVDAHRQRILHKMQVDSVIELIQLVVRADLFGVEPCPEVGKTNLPPGAT
jgi:two-component system response regulator FixJ